MIIERQSLWESSVRSVCCENDLYTRGTNEEYDAIRMNDCKDVRDLIIGITGSEKKANRAYAAVCEMGFGGLYTDSRFTIECVTEDGRSIWE